MPEAFSGESDEALVARSRRGDRDAFGELVRRWQRPLFSRALRNTGAISDADDLVQETFLRAWDGVRRIRDDTRFGPWVLRILANLAADRGRRSGREVGGVGPGGIDVVDTAPNPEEELLSAELSELVRRALLQIPPGRQQEMFRKRFVEGRTVREIAREIGVHDGTVKVHLFRLARGLRRRLEGGKEHS